MSGNYTNLDDTYMDRQNLTSQTFNNKDLTGENLDETNETHPDEDLPKKNRR